MNIECNSVSHHTEALPFPGKGVLTGCNCQWESRLAGHSRQKYTTFVTLLLHPHMFVLLMSSWDILLDLFVNKTMPCSLYVWTRRSLCINHLSFMQTASSFSFCAQQVCAFSVLSSCHISTSLSQQRLHELVPCCILVAALHKTCSVFTTCLSRLLCFHVWKHGSET